MVDKELALNNIMQYSTFAILILIVLMVIYIHQKKNDDSINRWKKLLNLDRHMLMFHELYQNLDGFSLSKQARTQSDAMEYVYGEIEFLPFIALLSLVTPDEDTVFYDLGSGTGKAVLASVMVYPVKKSVGVELFPNLHEAACGQKKQLAQKDEYSKNAEKIEFILGDFLHVPLDDATLIFINATALIGPTWTSLCQRIDRLPALEVVITTSKPLVCSHFTMTQTTQIKMSWGVVNAYIHIKKT